MGKKSVVFVLLVVGVVILSGWVLIRFLGSPQVSSPAEDESVSEEEDVPVSVSAGAEEIAGEPKDESALGGYNVLVADRGNNRLLEVTPGKKIVWEYRFNLPHRGLGADDAFFTNGGKQIITNLENYHILQLIDYDTKQVLWQYGTPGVAGSGPGFLHSPDDAYQLPSGDVIVADIKNCRELEVSPDKRIVRQYGVTGVCRSGPGFLNKPNGDTPLPNGHVLISTIADRRFIELDENWKEIFSMLLPVKYPSDPQMTKAGNILIADYSNPGAIIEISRDGKTIWQYKYTNSPQRLNKPSLAIELPNGNILVNDDYNHRVIVINKTTNQIVWQYGVTGKPGDGEGQLSIPDGVDIIQRTPSQGVPAASGEILPLHTIGEVTWHSGDFVGQEIRVQGYLLKRENGYVIFSDEITGALTRHDLPVAGLGIDRVEPRKKYILAGTFVYQGLTSSNHNPYHLELSSIPQAIE